MTSSLPKEKIPLAVLRALEKARIESTVVRWDIIAAHFSLLQTQILRKGFSDAINTVDLLRRDLEQFGKINRKFDDLVRGVHPIFQTLYWLRACLIGKPITPGATPESLFQTLGVQLEEIRKRNA